MASELEIPADTESSSSDLYVPLAKPPTALSLVVRALLGKVRDGDIRVPQFQRPLRWRPDDVVKLFDSILRGYPIGSLLFWKKQAPADEQLVIGNARISVGSVDDAWYIVDGQQRVTALAASLLDFDQQGDPRWEIRFDPKRSRFLSGRPNGPEVGTHVPLSVLGDIRRLGKWLRDCHLDESAQTRVEDVQQRLLDYQLSAYVMETSDEAALRGVFARSNSTGVRMRAEEVFQALLGSGARPGVELLELQEACDVDGFGQPPRAEVLKALLAMSGLDPSKRLEDLGEGAVAGLTSESEAIEALRRTVQFLQAAPAASEPGAGIPAYGFIPYPVAFVLLARWFHEFPEPDASSRGELARWLWRGVVGGVHQRAAVSAMRLQVRIIAGDEEKSLRALLGTVGRPPAQEWSLDRFNASHAASKVELLTLLAREPRDRVGPVSWRALLSSGDRVAREIFRSSEWKGLDPASQMLARTAANRVLLDARHTGLSVELRRWTWEADSAALESHLIDEEGLAALRSEAGQPVFLRRRAARLRTEVAAFLSGRAGLDEPQLFPVDSYYDGSSDDESE